MIALNQDAPSTSGPARAGRKRDIEVISQFLAEGYKGNDRAAMRRTAFRVASRLTHDDAASVVMERLSETIRRAKEIRRSAARKARESEAKVYARIDSYLNEHNGLVARAKKAADKTIEMANREMKRRLDQAWERGRKSEATIEEANRLAAEIIAAAQESVIRRHRLRRACNADQFPPPPCAFWALSDAAKMWSGRSGIYFVIRGKRLAYVGRSISLANRWRSHHVIEPTDLVGVIELPADQLGIAEMHYIWSLRPQLNREIKAMRRNKSYLSGTSKAAKEKKAKRAQLLPGTQLTLWHE